jgi:(p)ppGpp synthase/HD superfamily hydrolase
MRTETMTSRLELAMRWAAQCHDGQTRHSISTPYFEHVAAVALILDRAGFDEDVVIAGLLHDVVEDTPATFDDVAARFGAAVAEIVRHCSEVKTDAQGTKRPWIDRKRDHIAALSDAPPGARGVILADKLHNLICIELDLRERRPVWSEFHAEREQVLWYYHAMIEICGRDDPRLVRIAADCHDVLARVKSIGERSAPTPEHPPGPGPDVQKTIKENRPEPADSRQWPGHHLH